MFEKGGCNSDSSNSNNDLTRHNAIALVSCFSDQTRTKITLVMEFVDMIMDYFCDEAMSFSYMFITIFKVNDFHGGMIISSIGHENDIILDPFIEGEKICMN